MNSLHRSLSPPSSSLRNTHYEILKLTVDHKITVRSDSGEWLKVRILIRRIVYRVRYRLQYASKDEMSRVGRNTVVTPVCVIISLMQTVK